MKKWKRKRGMMMDLQTKHLNFIKEENKILNKYAKDLLKKIKAKTNLVIPNHFININKFVLFLEDFIDRNKLFDTIQVWKKYEEKYKSLWTDLIKDLPEPQKRLIESIINRGERI